LLRVGLYGPRDSPIEDLDWENVAEEIESLSRSERRGIRSHMARVVEHLMKLEYARGIFRRYQGMADGRQEFAKADKRTAGRKPKSPK
jgi:hypothetical protein